MPPGLDLCSLDSRVLNDPNLHAWPVRASSPRPADFLHHDSRPQHEKGTTREIQNRTALNQGGRPAA